jgi:hypothetical protein
MISPAEMSAKHHSALKKLQWTKPLRILYQAQKLRCRFCLRLFASKLIFTHCYMPTRREEVGHGDACVEAQYKLKNRLISTEFFVALSATNNQQEHKVPHRFPHERNARSRPLHLRLHGYGQQTLTLTGLA